MTVTFAMVAFGALMIYAGWTNRSLWALAQGDNTIPKPKLGVAETGITGPVTVPPGIRWGW